MDLPPAEQLLASAIQYLIEGNQRDAALLLLSCDAEYGSTKPDGSFTLILLGTRAVHDALKRVNENDMYFGAYNDDPEYVKGQMRELNSMNDSAAEAFGAVAPPGFDFSGFDIRVSYADAQPGWREELRGIAAGRNVDNQGVEIPDRPPITLWNYLRFRSKAEVKVAEELDRTGVLFLPNCLARLNASEVRVTREADFLVCHNGKWGILEVDGPTHERAAKDHDRDRLFQSHRIRVTQHYTSEECHRDAGEVVRSFLLLLEKNG